MQFAELLAALPAKQWMRISIALVVGEFVIPDDTDANASEENLHLDELGGFDMTGGSRSRSCGATSDRLHEADRYHRVVAPGRVAVVVEPDVDRQVREVLFRVADLLVPRR